MTKPRFFENFDNNHCLQCCIKMVIDTILPNNTSFQEIDMETEYDPNKYTWTVAGAMVLSSKVKNVKLLSGGFDYIQFTQEGEQYLERVFPPLWFNHQKEHASDNFVKERNLTIAFLNKGKFENVSFSVEYLEGLLGRNFLIVPIDYNKLYKLEGYLISHYVLVYLGQGSYFEFHDPGLPKRPSQKIEKKHFFKAFNKGEIIVVPRPEC